MDTPHQGSCIFPGKNLTILTGVEAVRKRPGLYGLDREQVDAMSDDEVQAVMDTFQDRYKPQPASQEK